MSGVGVMTARELVEEELVYGALRREQLWRMIGLSGAGFGVFGCLTAAAVALMVETPPPMVVITLSISSVSVFTRATAPRISGDLM